MRDRLLMLVLLIVGGVLGVWYGPSLIFETAAASDWNEVAATVELVEVVRESSGSGSLREVDYKLELSYRYAVDGREYIGTRYQVSRDLTASTQAEAEQRAVELRESPEIRVYVNPDDPQAAVMDQGGSLSAWMTTMFGWLLFVWGGSIYFTKVRPQRGLQPGPSS